MRDFILGAIALILALCGTAVTAALEDIEHEIHQVNTVDTEDDELTTWLEPYGGCDEAYLYPKSQGYAECKEHGLVP